MPSAAPLGLQAVILCGSGANLYPFTQTEDMPKALLPLGNRPMIYYPLDWCEKAGINSILVLTLEEHLQQIQSHFKSPAFTGTSLSNWLSKRNAALQIEATSSLNDNLQSADTLRIAHKKGWIKSDFLVMPCDVVVQGLTLQDIAGIWMVMQGAFGGGNIGDRKGRKKEDGRDGRRGPLGVWYGVEGEGAVKGQETDLIVLSPPSKTPLVLTATTPYTIHTLLQSVPPHVYKGVTAHGDFPLRKTLLQQNPKIQVRSTSHRDSHIYIFPHWILEFVEANPRLSSIKDDILPWLVKCSWQKGLGEKLGLGDILDPARPFSGGRDADESDEEDDCDISGRSTTRVSTLKYTFRKNYQSDQKRIEGKLTAQKKAASSGASTGVSSPGEGHEFPTPPSRTMSLQSILSEDVESNPIPLINRIPKVTALVTPAEYQPNSDAPYIRRVDTPQLYLSANLHLAKSEVALPGQHATSSNTATTGGSASSASVGFHAGTPGTPSSGPSGYFAGEQQQVKIDPTCTIAQKCTITQSDTLLGANVKVEEKVVIKRCVIGSNCVIEKGARLMGCVLLDGAAIEENVKLDGCIVGKNSRVGKNAVLKDCEVGHGYQVEEELEAKNERLVGLEGIEEDLGSSEEELSEEEEAISGDHEKGDKEYDEDEDSDYKPGGSEDEEETEESDEGDDDDDDLDEFASGDEEVIRGTRSGNVSGGLAFPAPGSSTVAAAIISTSLVGSAQVPLPLSPGTKQFPETPMQVAELTSRPTQESTAQLETPRKETEQIEPVIPGPPIASTTTIASTSEDVTVPQLAPQSQIASASQAMPTSASTTPEQAGAKLSQYGDGNAADKASA